MMAIKARQRNGPEKWLVVKKGVLLDEEQFEADIQSKARELTPIHVPEVFYKEKVRQEHGYYPWRQIVVMELVDGDSLEDMLSGVRSAAQLYAQEGLFRKLGGILGTWHKNKLRHGDFYFRHVFVPGHGHDAMVIDFVDGRFDDGMPDRDMFGRAYSLDIDQFFASVDEIGRLQEVAGLAEAKAFLKQVFSEAHEAVVGEDFFASFSSGAACHQQAGADQGGGLNDVPCP